MTETVRQAYQVPLFVCLDGHSEPIGTPMLKWQFLHPICEDWVWIDAYYCHRCGKIITEDMRKEAEREVSHLSVQN